MVDLKIKTKYLKRFQEIYEDKTKSILSDADALHYFESLICLVEAVLDGSDIKKIKLKDK